MQGVQVNVELQRQPVWNQCGIDIDIIGIDSHTGRVNHLSMTIEGDLSTDRVKKEAPVLPQNESRGRALFRVGLDADTEHLAQPSQADQEVLAGLVAKEHIIHDQAIKPDLEHAEVVFIR